MDIDLLSKMVKELILDRDRVVLPGLGSFVAEIVPSTFSDKGYTINPPYRRMYFRSRPDEGDELIVFYAKSNSLEREIAERIIRDFVKELRAVLHEKKTIVFPGLGRLRATKENHVFFVADENLDIYPSGFGLEPISLKTHNETPEQVSAAVVGLKSIISSQDALFSKPESTHGVSNPVAVEVEPRVADPAAVEVEPEVSDPAEVITESETTESDIIEIISEPAATAPEPAATALEPVVKEPAATAPAAKESEPAAGSSADASGAHIRNSAWKTFIKSALVFMLIAAILLLLFAFMARMFPESFDNILYTPEELEIVRTL